MRRKPILITFTLLLAFSLVLNIYNVLNWEKNDEAGLEEEPVSGKTEEYIYVAVFKNDPMIDNQDMKGMNQFAEDYGVNVQIMAPDKYDIEEQKRLLIEAIEKKPDGIMVCGTDPSLIEHIDMAIDAGIPVITVDADLPDSKRLAFVGSDFYDVGVLQAEAMVKLIGGKGTVAMLGMGGLVNMEDAYKGFRSVMENYSDIVVLDEFNDESNPEIAEAITRSIIEDYPNIAGISGFDSNSGPGIAKALEELGQVGKIKATCVDIAQPHLAILKSGAVQKLIGQKRELFTYYGLKLLYDLNHSDLKITDNDLENKITMIPSSVDTGLIEVDQTNIDDILY
ncbi:MAG TPA: substrate-binding domain-containing protein [Patescibacteria group bacterium]|nr:substrate-binding domain-containing protein [Patescibacteria group bacterium]